MNVDGAVSVNPPILQFGTGRFLQAHVDLFISQALAQGNALGGVAVVQSTDSPQSSVRAGALASGYPVQLRGMQGGERFEQTLRVNAVHAVWHARRDWSRLREAMAAQVQVIVSNTAENGFALDARDTADLLQSPNTTPFSYPAKLVVLLHHRWQQQPNVPLTLFPCELVNRNGDVLRSLVSNLARAWQAEPAFIRYVNEHCVWANSLVDRIVSTPLEPAGAIAEPYALWAIEHHPCLVLPCLHPDIVVTDDLAGFAQRKLWLLNLGHTLLAEYWLRDHSPANLTVMQAMQTHSMRDALEDAWEQEVLPVFEAEGSGDEALLYLNSLRDRLLNPFLEHRISDIAKDHAQKKQRRLAPVVQRARALSLKLAQPQLTAALQT